MIRIIISTIFLEQYKDKVGQYIVGLRESDRSTEGYCSLKYVQAISEHHLIREAPVHINMCKKKNISFLLKQTIKLFNDRVMYGKDMEESELYYKAIVR